jgi:type I restriction enzyme, R subunit
LKNFFIITSSKFTGDSTMKRTSEQAFESAIEDVLLASGFQPHKSKDFDRENAIFRQVAIDFIQTTQPKIWDKLAALHGDKTADRVIAALCKWMDTHGALNTLRHGFKCYGKTLRIAFFKPAHGLNPELEARYAANIVGLTRQLRFSPKNEKSLDVTLSVNGIPLITIELKNPLSNQTAADAIHQYRHDRDPREKIFDFKKRTLVHFAVDTEEVHMTTRLAGTATHFLPFNQGCNGSAGNPPDPTGRNYRTAYLWTEILQPNSLLDLLARFLHLQEEEKLTEEGKKVKKETMVFPRYHQLKAVREMVAAAATEGAGHNYLIEHSAGSGKSNTIGWLVHRLSSLHNASEQRVFESVIVVTDRVVLDRQLQNTIYQFDHRQGVVQKIEEDSRQLAEALENTVPIIITTLQKFPFVAQQIAKLAEERGEVQKSHLPTRKYAVIIDEAHSSQSGETATTLKEVLGGEELRQKAQELAAEEGESDLEAMYRSMAKRGQQPNISFFAFTATPKHKTLAIFGRNGLPFSKYTMRQAIEEGFIMDVLKSYITYQTFYRLLKTCEDDPNVERKKAARALSNYMRLHPYNISQKTEIMVEHFQNYSRHKIRGRAKAMVVTGSRLEAVRYKQAFDELIQKQGYPIKSLVAFSGTVIDDRIADKTYTEVGMNNGIREKDLPEEFATNEYQVLLVAEKYQTGFDQPLLHTMYIDKRLAGIQAVQTLSRLNRTHPLKEETFILDFVNDPEEIREAFKVYFDGAIMGEEVDPDRLYQIKSELDESEIYLESEIIDFCEIFFAQKQRQSPSDHKLMNALLDKAVERFKDFQDSVEEESDLWRGKVKSFQNLYAFLSQVIPYQDSDLEKLYTYLKHLALKLPKRKSELGYQFDEEIQLAYYRLQKISEGSISLHEGYAASLDGPKDVGSGRVREENVPLSRLIDLINDRFGEELNEADQLFFDQITEAASLVDSITQAAQTNPMEKFQLVFGQVLESLFIERMEINEDLFARYMNDPEFKEVVSQWLGQQVYSRIPKDISY